MKIVVTSDTHGQAGWNIPPCDVFIHCGDFSAGGSFYEIVQLAQRFFHDAPAKHILLVPGNHDACFQQQELTVRNVFGPNVQVLIDEEVVIDRLRFYGSPWTLPFNRWYFMASERQLERQYERMPALVDVLITHGPPYGILDEGWKTPHAGSKSLYDAIAHRCVRHHVFGHLHLGGGQTVAKVTNAKGTQTYFSNVAACDEAYQLVHAPLELEL